MLGLFSVHETGACSLQVYIVESLNIPLIFENKPYETYSTISIIVLLQSVCEPIAAFGKYQVLWLRYGLYTGR